MDDDILRDRHAAAAAPSLFSAKLTFTPDASTDGTRYRACAIHADAAGASAHAAMGFHTGWGAALDQLVALMQREGGGHGGSARG